ncbi:MAG: hypothetical protein EHM48_06535, partial [Planctomycetaceae bacterium]
MSDEHEENRYFSGKAGWAAIVLLCAVIIGWGYVNYFFIADTPRRPDMGALPDVPGESIYSTSPNPTIMPTTRQVSELPEAVPYRPSSPGVSNETPHANRNLLRFGVHGDTRLSAVHRPANAGAGKH